MSQIISIISGILLVISAIPYLIAIYKGEIKPRPLSWFGWFLILVSSIIAQIYEHDFSLYLSIVFGSAFACLLISTLSVIKKNKVFRIFDVVCFLLGIVCLIVFLTTKSAYITTIFSILADLVVGIPTLKNAYQDPYSENLVSWIIGSTATGLAFLVVIFRDNLLLKFYPSYLFLFNFAMFLFCFRRFSKKVV